MWGIIYIGSDKQPMSVMMDTGSPWVWGSSNKCTSCPGKYTFDSSTSTTFSKPSGWNQKALGYGSGVATGAVVHDKWCLSKDSSDATCYNNMKFVNAEKTTLSILKCSGVIGLGPIKAKTTDLFIDKIKEAGIIDKKIFSFSIGMGAYKNQMTFGGYDVSKFGQGPLQWHNIKTTGNFWLANITSVSLIWPNKLKKDTSSGSSSSSGGGGNYGYNGNYGSSYG